MLEVKDKESVSVSVRGRRSGGRTKRRGPENQGEGKCNGQKGSAVQSSLLPFSRRTIKQTSPGFYNYTGAMDRREKMAAHSPK